MAGTENTPSRDAQGVYLYCFARPCAGDEQSALETLKVQDVLAVFTRVPLADWEDPAIDSRLQDTGWLIPWALAHEQVIESFMARSPVLPARFGAVFSGEAALSEFVTHRVEVISGFLDRISNLEEWAVKGFLNPGMTEQWLEASDPVLAERRQQLPDTPGARYFQEKRLKAELQKRARQWGCSLSDTLYAELNSKAVSVCGLRSQQPARADQEMVFHAAFLLSQASVDDFRNHVAQVQTQYASQGLTLETSGPWPPYNFCPDLADSLP
jgi:hypothetical protein